MAISPQILRAAERAAIARLNDWQSNLLRELGRFGAANRDGFVPGHLVIPADEDLAFGVQARFVPLPFFPLRWKDEHHHMFAMTGGSATVWHFQRIYDPVKSGAEAKFFTRNWEKFFGRHSWHSPEDPDDYVGTMLRNYDFKVRHMEPLIEENRDRVAVFVGDNRFRMGAFHVIPSTEFVTEHERTARMAQIETRLTEGRRARQLALLRTKIVLRW